MATNQPRLLVIDDSRKMLGCLENCLNLLGYSVETALGGKEGIFKIESESFDLVLTDLHMPGVDGMEVIRRTRLINPNLKIIVITAYATIESAVRAMQAGAAHYITKPFKLDEMAVVLERALERGNHSKHQKRSRSTSLIGHCPAMQHLRNSIDMVANSTSTVLLQGASGSGKELVARAVHARSPRADNPFISCSCAAFTDTLLTNELFGHVAGSYTGAGADKRGLIEEADGGTLFLDEIGETTQQFQTALLRVIAEREIIRVGGTRPIPVDFRLLTATNRNLHDEVAAGNFREDLYYRLNVVTLNVPSLSERRDDIPLLARHFLRVFNEDRDKQIEGIAPDALELLQAYHWPGNVRQLESAIERAVLLCKGTHVQRTDLPPEVLDPIASTSLNADTGTYPAEYVPLKDARGKFEKQYIEALLSSVGGNVSRAASIALVARPHLHELMRRHNIDAGRFRIHA